MLDGVLQLGFEVELCEAPLAHPPEERATRRVPGGARGGARFARRPSALGARE